MRILVTTSHVKRNKIILPTHKSTSNDFSSIMMVLVLILWAPNLTWGTEIILGATFRVSDFTVTTLTLWPSYQTCLLSCFQKKKEGPHCETVGPVKSHFVEPFSHYRLMSKLRSFCTFKRSASLHRQKDGKRQILSTLVFSLGGSQAIGTNNLQPEKGAVAASPLCRKSLSFSHRYATWIK